VRRHGACSIFSFYHLDPKHFYPRKILNHLAGSNYGKDQHIISHYTIIKTLLHALLLDGCSYFSFEMPKKIIHVMDRTAGSRGLTATTKKKLALVANLIQKENIRMRP
jgi:hypothetical protein